MTSQCRSSAQPEYCTTLSAHNCGADRCLLHTGDKGRLCFGVPSMEDDSMCAPDVLRKDIQFNDEHRRRGVMRARVLAGGCSAEIYSTTWSC